LFLHGVKKIWVHYLSLKKLFVKHWYEKMILWNFIFLEKSRLLFLKLQEPLLILGLMITKLTTRNLIAHKKMMASLFALSLYTVQHPLPQHQPTPFSLPVKWLGVVDCWFPSPTHHPRHIIADIRLSVRTLAPSAAVYWPSWAPCSTWGAWPARGAPAVSRWPWTSPPAALESGAAVCKHNTNDFMPIYLWSTTKILILTYDNYS